MFSIQQHIVLCKEKDRESQAKRTNEEDVLIHTQASAQDIATMIPVTTRTAATTTTAVRRAAAGFFLLVATILYTKTVTTTRTTVVVVAFQPQQQQYTHHNTPNSVFQQQQQPTDEGVEVAPDSQNEELGTELQSRNRRSFIRNSFAMLPFAVVATTSLVPTLLRVEPAYASGGATAGGAYLLSAKKRYYERVKSAVHGLVAVNTALQQPEADLSVAKGYFSPDNTDDGSWKDLTAAGYLLSNAFRRSSSTAPDSLPAVKKYKAFAKEMDTYQKVLKKKGAVAAVEVYDATVLPALNAWLDEIDLPPAQEL